MVIGVSGPIDLKLLDCDFGNIITPTLDGFPLTSHFINALIKRNYQVIAYTYSQEITEPVILKSEKMTICIGCAKPQPGRRIFKYERDQLQSLMQQYPADIIYAYWTYEYAWAALDSGIPTVVSVHDIAYKILLKQFDLFRLVRYFMNNIVLSKANWVVANSSYTYSQLSNQVRKKAVVINNFYSRYLDNSTATLKTRKENYIVSVVMGFTKRKGIPKALHAFARLRKKFPTLEYHLIGVGMEQNGVAQQYARKHNIEEGVRFLGPMTHAELIPRVAAAKALLHPSVEESFGMAVLESMIIGTPVVGGKHSGFVPNLLNRGDAGVLCNIESESEMASSVELLLSDESFAEQVKIKAYNYARENFSEDVVVLQHLELFNSILHRNKPIPDTGTTEQQVADVISA